MQKLRNYTLNALDINNLKLNSLKKLSFMEFWYKSKGNVAVLIINLGFRVCKQFSFTLRIPFSLGFSTSNPPNRKRILQDSSEKKNWNMSSERKTHQSL